MGGGAQGKYQPKVVQCTQTGHDGIDYQWRCAAEMPQEYEFGAVRFSELFKMFLSLGYCCL